jgi:glyoxylase-like metal-dependent hydrolase (beta-lactamase superfamily II)/ferredoxin
MGMAQLNLRVRDNVPGELFVDSTCIECDTCRELAPEVFGGSGQSFVKRQPSSEAEWREALQAVVSCPTASIGAERSAREAARSLPVAIAERVFRCGYSSDASYGAQSYYLQREDGNVLVDSPRFAAPLSKRLAELGGVRKMFLTHSDDVADHARFHERFGCDRILHRDDDHIGAEISLDANPREIGRGLKVVPVPGHTRGSCALLADDIFLFSGDHLWGSEGRLEMGRGVCWYSWPEQKRSLRRLLDYRFEWVLPGHGRSLHLPAPKMRAELESLLRRL